MVLRRCLVLLLLCVLGCMHNALAHDAKADHLFFDDDGKDEIDPVTVPPFPEDVCKEPPIPANGELICGQLKTDRDKYVCKALCIPGYELARNKRRGKLICSFSSGRWQPKNKFPDCKEEVACWPPCQNGGECEEGNVCTCPPRYNGNRCEQDKCRKPPIPSNGKVSCRNSTDTYVCEAECDANSRFSNNKQKETHSCNLKTGEWLPEFDFPACVPICNPPCQNGGTCLAGNTCQCSPRYRGGRCQIDVCQSPPAPRNGQMKCTTPKNDENKYECVAKCTDGYTFVGDKSTRKQHICDITTGKWTPVRKFPDCEAICSPPCQNGGTCDVGNKCICTPTFQGDRCEKGKPVEMCPEVPTHFQNMCPAFCPQGSACNGRTCVPYDRCPCFKNNTLFELSGGVWITDDCERCKCVEGHSKCEPMKCTMCLPGQKPVMDASCRCSCLTCAAGTILCPTTGQCLEINQVCKGLATCPGVDLECPTGKCPKGMEYKFTTACPKTCENYKTYPEDECSIPPQYKCVCPEDEVLKLGKCVKTAQCEACDAQGHVAGDMWQEGPCKTCECLPDFTTKCTVPVCPQPPVCKSGEELVKLKKRTNSCCDAYICEPKTECPRPKPPICPPGNGYVRDIVDGCLVYRCECFLDLCPSVVVPPTDEGESVTITPSDCCPEVKISCNPNLCSAPRKCSQGFKLSTEKGRCCNKYKCVPQEQVCTYQHQYAVVNGTQKKLPLEGYYDREYQPGSSWQDGLCHKCVCSDINGQLMTRCNEQICPNPQDLPDADKYVREVVPVLGSCCPKFIRKHCFHQGITYKIGEEWTLPSSGNCRKDFRCVSDPNGEALISMCDTNC